MKKQLTAFFMAWGMFCAIPCPCRIWDDDARPWMIVWLPVVGVLVGAVWLLAAWAFGLWGFTGFLAAAILAALPYLLTGFIHLDGFMDCCDAILSRRDLQTRQQILKDSHVGAFSVICVGLLFLGSFAAFCDLQPAPWRALLLLPAASRCISGLCVNTLTPLGASQYAGNFQKNKKTAQTVCLAALLVLSLAGSVCLAGLAGISAAVAAACTLLFVGLARHNLGGMSGDISGFAVTLGELCGVISLIFLR